MAAAKSKYRPEETSKARNDAYTGMLVVSLIALLTGTVLLYLDYSQYPDKNPPKVLKVAPEAPLAADKAQEKPAEKVPEKAKAPAK
jgi:hypothetical protein